MCETKTLKYPVNKPNKYKVRYVNIHTPKINLYAWQTEDLMMCIGTV